MNIMAYLQLLLKRSHMIRSTISATMMTLSMQEANPNARSCRRFLRNFGWFRNVFENYSTQRFKQTFRLWKTTFTYIIEVIKPELARQTLCEEPICPEERLVRQSSSIFGLLVGNVAMALVVERMCEHAAARRN